MHLLTTGQWGNPGLNGRKVYKMLPDFYVVATGS